MSNAQIIEALRTERAERKSRAEKAWADAQVAPTSEARKELEHLARHWNEMSLRSLRQMNELTA